jgi:putative colanic acid biosynthesis UDP-glucose lipid carrier transferase
MLNGHRSRPVTAFPRPVQGDGLLMSVVKLTDSALIALSLAVPVLLRSQTWPPRYTIALLLALLTFHALAGPLGLYRPWRGESITRQFFRVLLVWLGTVFVLLLAAYAFKASAGFSRLAMTAWLVTTPLALSTWRMAARWLLSRLARHDALRRDALIWGGGEVAEGLADAIRTTPGLGLRLVGHSTLGAAQAPPPGASGAGPSPVADADAIERGARRGDFSILYIVLGGVPKRTAADMVERLSDTTVSVYLVPDYFSTHLFQGRWSSLEGIPLISVLDTPFWGLDGWLKRGQDLLLGSLLLALASVPMACIALALRLTSPGPILFRQRRYGIDGREITVLKFRSMRVAEDGDRVTQARRHDPRVTPIGSFLRRHSLDELPQLINVLRGEMSIVGPRPHAVAHNELYRRRVKGYMLRHKVKPGITGWAQVNGWRGETDDLHKMEQRVEHDLWYIRNWSFWLDMKIILLTLARGLTGPNAY